MFKANRKLLPRFNDISPILSAPLTPPYLTLPITQHQIPLCISTLTSAQRRPSCIYPNHSFPRSPQHSLSPDNISTITRPRRRTFSISIAIFTARSRSRSYTGTTTSITLRHVTIIDIVRVILIIWFFIVALDAFWDRDHLGAFVNSDPRISYSPGMPIFACNSRQSGTDSRARCFL